MAWRPSRRADAAAHLCATGKERRRVSLAFRPGRLAPVRFLQGLLPPHTRLLRPGQAPQAASRPRSSCKGVVARVTDCASFASRRFLAGPRSGCNEMQWWPKSSSIAGQPQPLTPPVQWAGRICGNSCARLDWRRHEAADATRRVTALGGGKPTSAMQDAGGVAAPRRWEVRGASLRREGCAMRDEGNPGRARRLPWSG